MKRTYFLAGDVSAAKRVVDELLLAHVEARVSQHVPQARVEGIEPLVPPFPTSPPWNQSKYAALVYALVALIAIVWMRDTWTTLQQTEAVPYSELQRLLRDGQVDSVRITHDTIRAELKTPLANGHTTTVIATRVEPALAKDLEEHGVRFEQALQGTLLRYLLSWIVPALARHTTSSASRARSCRR